jgi:hypothetical protein
MVPGGSKGNPGRGDPKERKFDELTDVMVKLVKNLAKCFFEHSIPQDFRTVRKARSTVKAVL